MSVTTIKVSTETRDLLKEQAANAGVSLGEYVGTLAREHRVRPWWEELRESIGDHPRTSGQRAEDDAWDATLADGLPDEQW